MRELVVVYDEGSVAPSEIAVGLADVADCVFVLGDTEHARAMAPLLVQFGPVVDPTAVDTYRPRGILTFSERALRQTADLARRLGLPYHDVGPLTDKWAQRAALRAAGVDTVRSHRVATESDWPAAVAAVGLPAVLKPAIGGASRNTYLVEDADTGRDIARAVLADGRPGFVLGGALVLEEYLRGRDCGPFGDYVSVENLTCDGTVHDIAVTGKLPLAPPFRETGYFVPAPLDVDDDKRVRELARAALAVLGVHSGFTHTEVKLTERGPRLIEVNGRLGAGVYDLAGRAFGIDVVTLAGRVALGEPVDITLQPPDHVYFQLFHPAPRQPCALVAVTGTHEVRRLPGVTLHRPYVRPGTALAGGTGTERLGVVSGEVADPAELAVLASEINARLRYRFDFGSTTRDVPAAELGAL